MIMAADNYLTVLPEKLLKGLASLENIRMAGNCFLYHHPTLFSDTPKLEYHMVTLQRPFLDTTDYYKEPVVLSKDLYASTPMLRQIAWGFHAHTVILEDGGVFSKNPNIDEIWLCCRIKEVRRICCWVLCYTVGSGLVFTCAANSVPGFAAGVPGRPLQGAAQAGEPARHPQRFYLARAQHVCRLRVAAHGRRDQHRRRARPRR